MFRGKESSNRIELSRLVQDLLNFGVLGSLWLWGWGVDGSGLGVVGGYPLDMCTCMHMHTHMHMQAHVRMLNMIISCKWLPPLGESLGIPYDVIHVCACMCMRACVCMCTCVGGTFSPPPYPHPPTLLTPQGGPPESLKIQ